jgi:hypothetical protein
MISPENPIGIWGRGSGRDRRAGGNTKNIAAHNKCEKEKINRTKDRERSFQELFFYCIRFTNKC